MKQTIQVPDARRGMSGDEGVRACTAEEPDGTRNKAGGAFSVCRALIY